MDSFVYVIPAGEEWLIYAPLHRISALVNTRAVHCLQHGAASPASDSLEGLLAALRAPLAVPGPRTGDLQPEFLGLIPTRACNLTCGYCGFGGTEPSHRRMESSLAAAAIDWMADRVEHFGRSSLDVHFFGGEPFLAGEVIDVAVHRTRTVASGRGLAPRLEAATNGMMDETRAQFAGDYFDTIVLSFDGPPEIQDRHRPAGRDRGSYATVARTAAILGRSTAALHLRLCVTEETVAEVPAIARWFCETFQPSALVVETLQVTPESAAAGLHPPDPYQFTAAFLAARRVAAAHGIPAIYGAALLEAPRVSFCPVGNDSPIVAPDGRVSACYLPEQAWRARGLDLNFGRLTPDGAMHLDANQVARVRQLVTQKPRCARCFCRFTCAGGCHVNHFAPGCSDAYDDFCVQTRLITAASLLADLDHASLLEHLFADRSEMGRLAGQRSDRLEDWEDTRGT